MGLRNRCLHTTRPILCVLDGAKALVAAVNAVFDHLVVHHYQLHKVRNVESKSPQGAGLHRHQEDAAAQYNLDAPAAEAILEASPGAWPRATLAPPEACGGTVRDLTVSRLGVPPTLARKPRSTNAVESIIEFYRDPLEERQALAGRADGTAVVCGRHERAAKQFRRVNGFLHLPALRTALEPHVSEAVAPRCNDDEVAA